GGDGFSVPLSARVQPGACEAQKHRSLTRTRQGRGDIHRRRRCQPGGAVTALPFVAFEWATQARVMHARQRSAVQKTDVPQCEISGLGHKLSSHTLYATYVTAT